MITQITPELDSQNSRFDNDFDLQPPKDHQPPTFEPKLLIYYLDSYPLNKQISVFQHGITKDPNVEAPQFSKKQTFLPKVKLLVQDL